MKYTLPGGGKCHSTKAWLEKTELTLLLELLI